jgi:diguanylate cyclase (GGDEF)-like protein
LKVAAKNDQSLAVFFLSLDPYARINHTLGPAMGDRLVRCVARRVKGVRPANAAVGYWGSDRFVLLLEDFADEAQIVEFAKDIKKRIERSFFSYKQEFFLTSSIGIARYPLHGATVETLLKNAGAALFEAQECGGNCYRIYSDDLDARSLKSFALENWLGRGLQRQQFSLQYQPQVNTDTGEIKGAEALIRWEHPELGPIQPADFIPFAEKSGLIIPIGEWVLRAACLQLKQWHADGFSGLTLAINVSARQLQEPAAVDLLVELLKESELDPEYLELELTESSLMTNAETVIKSLGKLKDIGVKLAIDDFGTGFSSLEYLRRLPLDILKIDQSFIRDTANHKGAALVTSIVALAHWLRLQVVAEGVETPEQAAFLQRLGCVVMQGYLFSRPLLSEQFKRLLSAPNHQFKESNQFAQAQAAS